MEQEIGEEGVESEVLGADDARRGTKGAWRTTNNERMQKKSEVDRRDEERRDERQERTYLGFWIAARGLCTQARPPNTLKTRSHISSPSSPPVSSTSVHPGPSNISTAVSPQVFRTADMSLDSKRGAFARHGGNSSRVELTGMSHEVACVAFQGEFRVR